MARLAATRAAPRGESGGEGGHGEDACGEVVGIVIDRGVTLQ